LLRWGVPRRGRGTFGRLAEVPRLAVPDIDFDFAETAFDVAALALTPTAFAPADLVELGLGFAPAAPERPRPRFTDLPVIARQGSAGSHPPAARQCPQRLAANR
jgi:hypothetical protein